MGSQGAHIAPRVMFHRKPAPPRADHRPAVPLKGQPRSLAQALLNDPTLKQRLADAGRWTEVDVRWAVGSVSTAMETTTPHPWVAEQEAAIQEIRATAAGTKRRKAGP